ncbi:MAG TPA: DUF5916 domain-containing protein [Gemmatimonadales bacterium]
MYTIRLLPVLLAGVSGSALAQADGIGRTTPSAAHPVAASGRAEIPPKVDGRLDDAVWGRAAPLGGFTQRDPREGHPVTERTEVRILSDGEAIYVAAWLYDRDQSGIVPGERLRDAELSNSDYFGIILDTYLDRQNGFIFSTTPSGIEYDGQVVKEGEGGGVFQSGQSRAQSGSMGGFNLNWDGSWTVATSIDSAGWYAEFRIPFSTLRYGAGASQRWGLNLVRGIRRRNEEAFWAPIPRQFNLMRLSLAGTLEGLQVPSRRAATVTPYLLGAARRDFSQRETEWPREAGADAKLGLTPSLTLDLTYNTDFAQVEVDEQRTNLTRFPLFFPEKRPFFLENAGIFATGTPQAADLFFSRRVGIGAEGQPVPLLGGGRLTGKVAGLTVGVLQIFTDDLDSVTGNSYSVARVTREIGGRSRVGALLVQRVSTGDGDDYNRTYALDGRLGLGTAWTVDWWGAATETPGRDGRETAWSVRIGQQTGQWTNSVRVLQVGEDFNPEVGFLPRSGYRFFEGSILRTVRTPGISWMRQWIPHFTYRGYYGFDGAHQSSYYHIDPEFDFQRGGRLGPELNIQGETLTEPFEIAEGVVLGPGRYTWAFNGWDFSTNPSAPVSFLMRLDLGGFYTGSRYGGSATVTFRPGASFTSSLLAEHNDVHLDQGDFTRSLLGLRLGYFFTPRIFLQSLLQYNNQARIWTANARFGWLNTAGTGLFVVFNEAQEAEGLTSWVRPQLRSFTVKFTRQFGTGG